MFKQGAGKYIYTWKRDSAEVEVKGVIYSFTAIRGAIYIQCCMEKKKATIGFC